MYIGDEKRLRIHDQVEGHVLRQEVNLQKAPDAYVEKITAEIAATRRAAAGLARLRDRLRSVFGTEVEFNGMLPSGARLVLKATTGTGQMLAVKTSGAPNARDGLKGEALLMDAITRRYPSAPVLQPLAGGEVSFEVDGKPVSTDYVVTALMPYLAFQPEGDPVAFKDTERLLRGLAEVPTPLVPGGMLRHLKRFGKDRLGGPRADTKPLLKGCKDFSSVIESSREPFKNAVNVLKQHAVVLGHGDFKAPNALRANNPIDPTWIFDFDGCPVPPGWDAGQALAESNVTRNSPEFKGLFQLAVNAEVHRLQAGGVKGFGHTDVAKLTELSFGVLERMYCGYGLGNAVLHGAPADPAIEARLVTAENALRSGLEIVNAPPKLASAERSPAFGLSVIESRSLVG